jgi:hypothetical protein
MPMDLLTWAASFPVPHRSDGAPRKARFTAATLPAPEALETDRIRGLPSGRRPANGAVVIDEAVLTAEREGFRALGLAFLAYALSEQRKPLRITLPAVEGELAQIVLWPPTPSRLEAELGCRLHVHEVFYRPRLADENPNYTTAPDDYETYPRQHRPYCTVAKADHPENMYRLPGSPECAHLGGTPPAHVWLGKYLLNLALEDSNVRLAYLYNYVPAKSMARRSAELRLVVANPDDGPVRLPPHQDGPAAEG